VTNHEVTATADALEAMTKQEQRQTQIRFGNDKGKALRPHAKIERRARGKLIAFRAKSGVEVAYVRPFKMGDDQA
jgi:hypothetical protein